MLLFFISEPAQQLLFLCLPVLCFSLTLLCSCSVCSLSFCFLEFLKYASSWQKLNLQNTPSLGLFHIQLKCKIQSRALLAVTGWESKKPSAYISAVAPIKLVRVKLFTAAVESGGGSNRNHWLRLKFRNETPDITLHTSHEGETVPLQRWHFGGTFCALEVWLFFLTCWLRKTLSRKFLCLI